MSPPFNVFFTPSGKFEASRVNKTLTSGLARGLGVHEYHSLIGATKIAGTPFRMGWAGSSAFTRAGRDGQLLALNLPPPMTGAALGTLAGLVFGLPGIVIGPFVGALVGELTVHRDWKRAGRAGLAAWIGFAIGTAVKVALAFVMGFVSAAALRRSRPAPVPTEWQQTLDRLIERMHVSRRVRLLPTDRVDSPSVIGWLRPVILAPVGALCRLSPEQVEALLAHELAHGRMPRRCARSCGPTRTP